MNWFMHMMAVLFRRAVALARRRTRSHRWQEELYDSMADKDELLEPFQEGTGHRQREVHVIGPTASSDGIGWDQELVEYMDDQRVQTSVTYRQARRCDCGAVLAYDNSVLGTCRACSRVVCKQEGCAARCERCGVLVCARHAVRIREHTFCPRHRFYGLWLCFWGLLK